MENSIQDLCAGCAGHAADGTSAGGTPIDRRELLKRGGLAAAALLLAACGSSDATGLGGGKLTIKLSDYPQLSATGGVALVSPSVAVVNNGGAYIALSRVCPHQGGQIGDTGSNFQCPVHGATFTHAGAWVGGQPTSNMQRLTVTSNSDGTLTIG